MCIILIINLFHSRLFLIYELLSDLSKLSILSAHTPQENHSMILTKDIQAKYCCSEYYDKIALTSHLVGRRHLPHKLRPKSTICYGMKMVTDTALGAVRCIAVLWKDGKSGVLYCHSTGTGPGLSHHQR